MNASISINLRELREKYGRKQNELAHDSGITAAQLSQIENYLSDITINSLVKIAYGLNIDFVEMMAEFGLRDLNLRYVNKMEAKKEDLIIKTQDIEAFYLFYRDKPQSAKMFLYDSFEKVFNTAIKITNEEQPIKGNQETNKQQQDVFIDINADHDAEETESEASEIIHEAILPFSNRYLPLPYPRLIPNETLEEIIRKGGVISLHDLGSYLRGCRKNQNVTLKQLSESAGFSYKSLIRLEKADLSRVSFTEMQKMDAAMHLGGNLIAICWLAGEFQTGIIRNRLDEDKPGTKRRPPIGWTPEELAFADTLITLSRWYKFLDLNKIQWFEEFQQNIDWYIQDPLIDREKSTVSIKIYPGNENVSHDDIVPRSRKKSKSN